MRCPILLLVTAAALLSACGGGSSGAGPEPGPTPGPSPTVIDAGPWALDPARGEALYGELCVSCHQANGSGGYGPALDNTASCPPCERFDTLWERIDEAMPLRNPGQCVEDCARDIAAWIVNGFSIAPSCTVEFRYDSIAGGRFTATVRIDNFRGLDVPEWRLGFTLDEGQRITAAPAVTVEQDGAAVLIRPQDGNRQITDGGAVVFALEGSHLGATGVPVDLRLEAPPCFTATPGPQG
ncbi:MAG TPA: cellulose binding domain-containing protein [Fontimonas sp.]